MLLKSIAGLFKAPRIIQLRCMEGQRRSYHVTPRAFERRQGERQLVTEQSIKLDSLGLTRNIKESFRQGTVSPEAAQVWSRLARPP